MAERFKQSPLVTWSLATFHTGGFIALLVALLYASGGLGALLASLNTLVGLLLFVVLWLTTWWCTRRGLRAVPAQTFETPFADAGAAVRALLLGGLWGGFNGVLFLVILLAGIVASLVVQLFTTTNPGSFFIPLFGLFALPVAFLIGAMVGVLFAMIDGVLFVLTDTLALRYTVTEKKEK